MASVTKRPNGQWRARYRDSAGKEHARHFARKVDAQAWLDGVTTAVQTGSYVDPARSRLTVGSLAEQWIEGKVSLKPTTRALYDSVLGTHVLPRCRNRHVHAGAGDPAHPVFRTALPPPRNHITEHELIFRFR